MSNGSLIQKNKYIPGIYDIIKLRHFLDVRILKRQIIHLEFKMEVNKIIKSKLYKNFLVT